MTAIAADSALADVFAAQDWAPSTTDLDAWTTLNPATDDTRVVTDLGLFGVDLTDFLADCTTATSSCKPADYDNFNGWGIGLLWSKGAGTIANGEFDQVLLVETLVLAEVEWITNSPALRRLMSAAPGNVVSVFDVKTTYTPAATIAAADSTNDAAAVTDPFDAWYAPESYLEDDEQLLISFIDETDTDFTFQVGDTQTAWVYLGSATGVGADGVKTDVTLAGAAQLTAAAAAIVATLLF